MDRTLNKRILRDLRKNIGRYLAMMLMITLGIYLVVSIVGSAEMVIMGTEHAKEKNHVEDGQFSTFLPLTEKEIESLETKGTVIEECFSFDINVADGVELRIFQIRKEVDLIMLEEGHLAEAPGEAVLERNYARAHELKTGDFLTILGCSIEIVGIGSVPDYDAALKTFSSPAADAHGFGLLFVSKKQYEELRDLSGKTEEYTYAFRLGKETADELKEKIKSLDFDYEKVENPYFRESIGQVLDEKKDAEDALAKLSDGTGELLDGLSELDGHGSELTQGANSFFDTYLDETQKTLASMGMDLELTRENYEEVLEGLYERTGIETIAKLKDQLNTIRTYTDGVEEYAGYVTEATDGAQDLDKGMKEYQKEMQESLDELYEVKLDNLTSFVKAEDNLRLAAAAGDVIMDKQTGLAAGVIVLILFAYVPTKLARRHFWICVQDIG